MKEGLAYISKRTNQLRYASGTNNEGNTTGIFTNNPDEQWLQQISIYWAKDSIKRGDPVSIAAVNLNQIESQDPNPYVEITDASRHTKCVGIALENANKGQPLHVQPFGKVIYDNKKDDEHKFDITGTYDKLAGKVVYIGQEPGSFTIDFDKAYENSHNIIQVGVITDAPAKNTNQKEYAIELQPEADGRGPLDSTQFELIVGEKITFGPNELKVLAISPDGKDLAKKFVAKVAGSPSKGFILFEPVSKDGTAVLWGSQEGCSLADQAKLDSIENISSSSTSKAIFEGLIDYEDYDVYISSLAKEYVSVTVIRRPRPADKGEAVVARAGFKSRSQIVGVYKNGSETKTFKKGDIIKVIKQGLINHEGLGLEPGKKYYLGAFGDLVDQPDPLYDTLLYVGMTTDKCDLLVDCHNVTNAHGGVKPVGFIKKLEGAEPEYGYLSLDPEDLKELYYTESVAEPENSEDPESTSNPVSQGPFEREKSFNIKDYRALYNFLVRTNQIPMSEGETFNLPEKVGCQIKYLDEGYDDLSVPRVPYIKCAGVFSKGKEDGSDTVQLNPDIANCPLAVNGQGYDVSSLVYWSPMGRDNVDVDVSLSAFDIHLSVWIKDGDKEKVVEIYPGFHQYGSNVYGFNWKLECDNNNRYILSADTGDLGNFGIAYIADPKKAPTLLDNLKYEIYVSRRDNGYTSIDLVKSILSLTQNNIGANINLPVSGAAVESYVNGKLDQQGSRLKAKKVLGISRDIFTDTYESDLQSHFELENSDYNDLFDIKADDTIASKALYEINPIIYKYVEDFDNSKPFMGVLIDQLEKIVDDGDFSADHNVIMHGVKNEDGAEVGVSSYEIKGTQVDKIKKIISLLTNDKNSAQVISSSVGLLIKAAGETQKRLLNIESALFGRDYKTLPDSIAQKENDPENEIYPDEAKVSSLPAQIGITRIVNALAKETLGSDNPTGEAADPDNSSNGNRIKDLYKQIEGTNGAYGEAGIELNLLDGNIDSFINDADPGQEGTGFTPESEKENQIGSASYGTYPEIKYGEDATILSNEEGTFKLTSEDGPNPQKPKERHRPEYTPLKGINDALNRIMYKLNILTSEIHGYDDILSSPERLNFLRKRLNQLYKYSYVKKSKILTYKKHYELYEEDDIAEQRGIKYFENQAWQDPEEYNPNNPVTVDITEDTPLRDIYLEDFYTKWSDLGNIDMLTTEGFITKKGEFYRASIIELIKQTIGWPQARTADDQTATFNELGSNEDIADFTCERNILSHSKRLLHLETALDTVIKALFKGDKDREIEKDYSNLNDIIGSTDDQTGDQDNLKKADITHIQRDWATNDGFETLNKLIYFNSLTPNPDNNIIKVILNELTGQTNSDPTEFGTEAPETFIDAFKRFLKANHYCDDIFKENAEEVEKRFIPFDEIFDLRPAGLYYKNESEEKRVIDKEDLKYRNIFYAKYESSDGSPLRVDENAFVKKYAFKSGVVYQFYRTADNKFGLVNDYSEITLMAGDEIKIHGQDEKACVTIKVNEINDGKLDIKAENVKTLVIPTSNENESETGALYIKQ